MEKLTILDGGIVKALAQVATIKFHAMEARASTIETFLAPIAVVQAFPSLLYPHPAD